MICIDLMGGPGCGKSTNAAGLFSLMKRRYYNVELVREFAKDLTYERDWERLKQQVYILDEQDRRQRMLLGQVDYIVTDGSLINSILYRPADYHISQEDFEKLVLSYYDKYNHIVFMLGRTKKYVPIGRTQTEKEAKDIDTKTKEILDRLGIPYIEIVADDTAPQKMLEHIENLIKQDIGE